MRIPLPPPEARRVENRIIGMGTYADSVLAQAIDDTASRFDCMGSIPTKRFPGGSFARTPLLVLAMLYYTLPDKF